MKQVVLLLILFLTLIPFSSCGLDTDGDGEPDQTDLCPTDPNKTEPGECGCNVADGTCSNDSDTDEDGDGIEDELDNCPSDANPDQSDIDSDGLGDVCDPDPPEGRHVFVINLAKTGISDSDYQFLALIPAGTYLNDGTPAVLAIPDTDALQNDLYIKDYLSRYRADKAYTINFTKQVPHAQQSIPIEGTTATDLSTNIALEFWQRSSQLVLANKNKVEDAIMACALAAYLTAPLVVYETSNPAPVNEVIESLGVEQVISVGSQVAGINVPQTTLAGAVQVFAYANQVGQKVKYVAATNAADHSLTNNDGPKLSLVAPLVAARRKGLVIPVQNNSSASSIRSELAGYYQAWGYYPTTMAIVGSATGFPMHFVDDPCFSDQPDIGTDFYYSDVDADPFPDIALGRINAENVFDASLLASRISTYTDLEDGTWNKNLVQCGNWNYVEAAPLLKHYGYTEPEYLVGQNLDHHHIEAAFIMHKNHSNHASLGGAFQYGSADALLAPAIIVSKGCSVAGIYQSGNNYISRRLLRLGAVAFVGTTQISTGTKSQAMLGFMNKILEGKTQGEAFRYGLSSMVVRMLNEPNNRYIQRSIFNLQLYGDPGMQIHSPRESPTPLPQITQTPSGIQLTIANKLLVAEHNQSMQDEWGWTGEHLYDAELPGVDSLTGWGGNYDVHKQVYTVAYQSSSDIGSVVQIGSFPSPLGKVGSHHNDYHQDGTQTVYWHVRILDYNQETGVVKNRLESIGFDLQ